MQASTQCYDFIKKQEGFSLHAYLDGGGVPTIGWGTIRYDNNSPVKMGQTIAAEEAQHFLEREVHRIEDAINETVTVALTQAEFDCLVDFFYNVGTGWCTGKNHKQAGLIRLLNEGKYTAVPAQLMLFTHDIHGNMEPGLVKRRKWESQMWFAGENDHSPIVASVPQNDAGQMPQQVTMRPAMPVIVAAVKTSHTLRAAAIGVVATAAHGIDTTLSWSKETAGKMADAANDLGPLQTILGMVLKNGEYISIGILGVAIVWIIARKLSDTATGKAV